MKKLFTLLILIGGFVCTASATDYIISGDAAITKNGHSWWHQDNDNKLTETTTEGIYSLVVEGCELVAGSSESNNYGFKVKVSEETWDDASTFPSSNYVIYVPYDGTYTLIYYVDIENKAIRVIAQPELRWNLGNGGEGNWDWLLDDDSKFTKDGDFGWNFEVSSANFTGDFSFRIFSGVYKKQAYPGGQDLAMSYGSSASSSAYFDGSSTNWSWRLTKPSYTFDKVVIHAVYKPFDTTNDADYGQWEVSADAYLPSITTNDYGYCTYVNPVALTISDATAYYATDRNNGSASAHAITNPAANTPMLIKGERNTEYSFKVATSGTDYSSTNVFKAGTGSTLASTTGDKYNYILNGNTFKAANGQNVATNKAYLQLSKQADTGANARILTFPDDEAAAVHAITTEQDNDSYYNLHGVKVAQPTKGLYIHNGKKLIVK